jgi:hypothetical protein
MIRAISSLLSLEASIGSLLGVDLSFFSSVALNATGCTSGVELAPCSKLTICLESLIISSKLTNLPTLPRETSAYILDLHGLVALEWDCEKQEI